jgi:DNA polymerase-4
MIAETGAPRIKKISITLHDLAPASVMPRDLFATAPAGACDRLAHREKLSTVMDSINQRHGRDAVVVGALPSPGANFSGTKVAFTRIPDLAEFRE